jgi:hypothetical protein
MTRAQVALAEDRGALHKYVCVLVFVLLYQ